MKTVFKTVQIRRGCLAWADKLCLKLKYTRVKSAYGTHTGDYIRPKDGAQIVYIKWEPAK